MTITPLDTFVLRSALFPTEALLEWSERGPATVDDEQAYERRVAALADGLVELVGAAEVREAIYLASASLESRVDEWRAAPRELRHAGIERALVRYLARMAARATPFGLFAGCSVGTLGATTALRPHAAAACRRHSRLDGEYLEALAHAVAAHPAIARALRLAPSSSLYAAAGRLRYAERCGAAFVLSELERSPELDAILRRARGGAAAGELVALLVSDDVAEDEAAAFVAELVAAQVLVPELSVRITGGEAIHAMIEQLDLADHPEATRVAELLRHARDELAAIDRSPLGAPPARYRALAAALAAGPAPISAALVQVDLVRPAAATLGPQVIAELTRGVELLRRLCPAEPPTQLARLAAAFEERYGDDEVPLALALDVEDGLGGLLAPASAPPDEGTARWTAGTSLLWRELERALRDGTPVVELDERDVLALPAPRPLPASFAVVATLLGPGAERVWLASVTGPSGGRMLGRFCHADPEVHALVARILRAEEEAAPHAIFAEIVHLPHGRAANVLARPRLRDHELPYLGCSGAPASAQLALDDLWLSTRDGRLVLCSERLGREVIPRLTTAHDFSGPSNLPIYRFLCALQLSTSAELAFSWGPLGTAARLPRVCSGALVLAPARWRLPRAALRSLVTATGVARLGAARALRVRCALPRWIVIVDGDHAMPIDLENPLMVDALAHSARAADSLEVTEWLGADSAARSASGTYAHEVVVPFSSSHRPAAAKPRSAPRTPRAALPGGEWLFAKLYCGPTAGDRLLTDHVAPAIRAALGSGAARSWFYLRYADPSWHLRVRLQGDPRRLTAEVLPALESCTAAGLHEGLCWRMQVDTYQREVERYGGAAGLALSEALFRADSDACLELLEEDARAGMSDDRTVKRFRWALGGVHRLLEDLRIPAARRRELIARWRAAHARALGPAAGLDAEYRASRRKLEAALVDTPPSFDTRSRAPVLDELVASERRGELTRSREELAESYVHLHANRLLRGATLGEQEARLYYVLDRLYQARAARSTG